MFIADNSLLRHLLQAAAEGSVIVTARTRAARWLSREFERRQVEQGSTAWQTPAILPLGAWLQQGWAAAQSSGAAPALLLEAPQRQKLWAQILGGHRASAASAAPAAVAAWELMHEYSIPENHSLFGLTNHGREFAGWAREYRALCRKQQWIDTAALPGEFAALLGQASWLVPQQMIFWGFDAPTAATRGLLTALQDGGCRCEWLEAEERNFADCQRLELPETAEELRRAAQWARAILLREPAARIGIVLPELRDWRDAAERILLRELDPAFFSGKPRARVFDISLGRELAAYAPVRAALLAMRWAVEPLSFAEVRELLLSPFLDGAAAEFDGRARLLERLSGVAPEPVTLEGLLRLAAREREMAPILLNHLREYRRLAAALPAHTGYAAWSRRLTALLAALGWCGESVTVDSVGHQSVERWRQAMDAFATLDLVAPQATATEAVQSILSAVEAIPFAPENIGAPVQLMGHDEAAGTFHDYLWIGGLSEESWPPHQTPNPFLPLGLQAGFGVTQAVAELQTAAARRTLQRLTAASGMTIFSSPQSAEGASLHPSRMIASLRRIEGRELILDDAGGWRRAEGLGQLCESLEDTQAPPLKPEELLHHGTKVLELQSLCPFHAFAEMRLSAGGRDAAEPGVRRRDRGRILERALQLLWERLGESRALHSLSAEARRTSIAEATGQALAELFDAPGDPLHGPLAEIERQCICSLIDKWLEVELARPEFTVEAHQRKIEFTLGGLPLRGCIDRLDRVGQGMEILDYKASEYYKSSNWQTPRPVQPQLPLYALAMRAEGQTVAALAFARITEKECKLDGVAVDPSLLSKSRGGGDSLDARMDEWQAELSRLAAGHLAGEAAVDPKVAPEKGGGSCKFCQLAALCRIAEKEPEDADEEGEGGDE